jgi:uncharacterized protein (TIGR03435 family)
MLSKMIGDDLDLLREFVRDHSQDAFALLVQRHVNLVYSAALRQVGAAHLAEDVAQCVFTDLARHAHRLKPDTILTAWLYQVTRRTAIDTVRHEVARQTRERIAMEMLEMNANAAEWTKIAPLLDEAMQGLDESDRTAVLLRFFENKSLREVGETLGTSDDTAQKRVSRAVDRLREFFIKRGVSVSASGLAGIISGHSVQAAPAALAKAAAAGAIAHAGAGSSALAAIKGGLKFMAWTKARIAVAAGLLVVGGTATLACLKWEAYKAYRGASQTVDASDPEAWRNPANSFAMVENAAPQLMILPTKFRNVYGNLKGSGNGLKWVGIGVPIGTIAWVAYECAPARVLFASAPPVGRYDFITSLPEGSLQGLQEEMKKTLGYTGHREVRETDVLLLKVRNANASGLRPATGKGGQNWHQEGRYFCDDVPISSTNRASQGLAQFLEQVFELPVIDQTGLTEYFNLDLRWDARNPNQLDAIKKAMLTRLGLELAPARQPVEMVVMERIPQAR